MAQLWGGRFTKETDKLVYAFNASISYDKKFYRQDIEPIQTSYVYIPPAYFSKKQFKCIV